MYLSERQHAEQQWPLCFDDPSTQHTHTHTQVYTVWCVWKRERVTCQICLVCIRVWTAISSDNLSAVTLKVINWLKPLARDNGDRSSLPRASVAYYITADRVNEAVNGFRGAHGPPRRIKARPLSLLLRSRVLFGDEICISETFKVGPVLKTRVEF